jgi:hypothetical protein
MTKLGFLRWVVSGLVALSGATCCGGGQSASGTDSTSSAGTNANGGTASGGAPGGGVPSAGGTSARQGGSNGTSGTSTGGGATGGAPSGGSQTVGGTSASLGGSTGGAGAGNGGGTTGGAPSGGVTSVGGTSASTTNASIDGGCPVSLACDAQPPDPGAPIAWRHSITSAITVALGSPQHWGRDLLLAPSDQQWVIAKFAYGQMNQSLVDEDVRIYLLRDCMGNWEDLGTATTTSSSQHATVEGVADTGGLIYFPIPDPPLGVGHHRFHLVVSGDLSATDLFIEVIQPGTAILVSDIDGTLTTTETEDYASLLTSGTPDANSDAPQALGLLADKGVRPFYLTARPAWLGQVTRDFLDARGFPPGIVHTALTPSGAPGSQATPFKTAELAAVSAKGGLLTWGFGNTSADADAYEQAGISPVSRRIFFQYSDSHGGRRIESFSELLAEFDALPGCQSH